MHGSKKRSQNGKETLILERKECKRSCFVFEIKVSGLDSLNNKSIYPGFSGAPGA